MPRMTIRLPSSFCGVPPAHVTRGSTARRVPAPSGCAGRRPCAPQSPWLSAATERRLVPPGRRCTRRRLAIWRAPPPGRSPREGSGSQGGSLEPMNESDAGMAVEFRAARTRCGRQRSNPPRPSPSWLRRLKRHAPRLVVTCAREARPMRRPSGKAPDRAPSRHSGCGGRPQRRHRLRPAPAACGELFLTISQSGTQRRPPRIRRHGQGRGSAHAAIVTTPRGPLARASDIVVPMAAGPELKRGGDQDVRGIIGGAAAPGGGVTGDHALDAAARPACAERVAAASDLDWSAALSVLAETESLVAIGRGPTLAIAREASLKFKETCNLHAEAFQRRRIHARSVALVSMRYPTSCSRRPMPPPPACASLRRSPPQRRRGVHHRSGRGGEGRLPALRARSSGCRRRVPDPELLRLIVGLAERRGTNVNRPRHLQKVTRTR